MKMYSASECPRGGNSAQAVNSAAQFEVRGGCFSYSAGEENLCNLGENRISASSVSSGPTARERRRS